MSMSDILCVTNRKLCRDDFLERVREIAACRPRGILLREKDLPEEEYRALAAKVLEICREFGTPYILHSFYGAAAAFGAPAVHLPLHVLRTMKDAEKRAFSVLGASCHSIEEAREAQSLGCTYLTAGHVFETDCKRGLPGRGLEFLREVCNAVSVPVYGIGGIDAENAPQVRAAGADGICVMSGVMQCADVRAYLHALESEW